MGLVGVGIQSFSRSAYRFRERRAGALLSRVFLRSTHRFSVFQALLHGNAAQGSLSCSPVGLGFRSPAGD